MLLAGIVAGRAYAARNFMESAAFPPTNRTRLSI
jgi:hypothetical protein